MRNRDTTNSHDILVLNVSFVYPYSYSDFYAGAQCFANLYPYFLQFIHLTNCHAG